MCDEMAEVVTVWVELGVWKGVKRLVGFEIGSTKMPAGSFASDTHRFECCGWRACGSAGRLVACCYSCTVI